MAAWFWRNWDSGSFGADLGVLAVFIINSGRNNYFTVSGGAVLKKPLAMDLQGAFSSEGCRFWVLVIDTRGRRL